MKDCKYLDPKADLTFKLVFGEHKDLAMSLLNALLPLADDEKITSLEYATPEMIPENPAKKDSIVDVRCTDAKGRQFIVEMQMYWNQFFQKSAMSEGQLYAYEKFWSAVINEEALIQGSYEKGIKEERQKNLKEKLSSARVLKENGVPLDVISKSLNMTEEDLVEL